MQLSHTEWHLTRELHSSTYHRNSEAMHNMLLQHMPKSAYHRWFEITVICPCTCSLGILVVWNIFHPALSLFYSECQWLVLSLYFPIASIPQLLRFPRVHFYFHSFVLLVLVHHKALFSPFEEFHTFTATTPLLYTSFHLQQDVISVFCILPCANIYISWEIMKGYQ